MHTSVYPLSLYHWLVLATWYRRDGTPVPDRKLLNLVAQGDPVAIAFLAAVILGIAWRAYTKSFHRP
jgi:hypothetical protein